MTFQETRAALRMAATMDEREAESILTFADDPGAGADPLAVEAARIVSRYVALKLATVH